MTISRRGIITGLISFAAAPAIVRIESLMPVKVMRIEVMRAYDWYDYNLFIDLLKMKEELIQHLALPHDFLKDAPHAQYLPPHR